MTSHICRSPWSNKYDPPLDDGTVPSGRLRKLEMDANQAFDTYREMYFESGICSVYVWDLDHGFAIVVLIKKGWLSLGKRGGRGGERRGGRGGERSGKAFSEGGRGCMNSKGKWNGELGSGRGS